MNYELIAPCGMYCGICSAYLAYKNNIPRKRGFISYCKGCRPRKKMCAYLKKNCNGLLTGEIRYCFECEVFPCERLSKIDARYKNNYSMSFIGNLKFIQVHGEEKFIEFIHKQYKCSNCNGLKSVHNQKCFSCEQIIRLKN